MADGVTVPLTGSGDATAKMATDDTGTPGHVQIVKPAISTDGSATLIPSDAANGLDVDVTRVSGNVATTMADGASVSIGATGDASSANTVIGRLKNLLSRFPAALGQTTKSASLPVVLASDSDAFNVTGSVSVTGTMPANVTPTTTGGLDVKRTLAAASTNATSVKASAGQVYGWYLYNAAAYPVFLKLYNKASAPTVGTDTPFMTLAVPATATGSGANVEITNGIPFGTGIAFAITKLVADSDTTAVVANDLVVNLFYK
jgi:hypothetical protein